MEKSPHGEGSGVSVNIESHYENLKVMRDAPPEVIRAAYKALAQALHPDRNPRPEAAEYMVIINAAYAVLGDAEKRASYDAWLEAEELRWTLSHPTIQPGYVAPRPPVPKPQPVAPKVYRPFEIDEALFAQAMKRAKPLYGEKRKYLGTYFRICAWYGAVGMVLYAAKLTFSAG